MDALCIGPIPFHQRALTHNLHLRRHHERLICNKSMVKTTSNDAPVYELPRRSGNYQPSPWDHSYLLSIDNKYVVKQNEKEVMSRDVLKKRVKKMLYDVETKSRLEQLELIDDLQKLGVSYHFELEISNILTDLYLQNGDNVVKYDKEENLHETSLEFRLLRQHGFDVSEDIFDLISDKIKSTTFKIDDIKSIVTLYEASYLSTNSDTKLLKVIRPFVIEKIKKFVDNDHDNGTYDTKMAIHALEMPYHWRMRRLETRWYIDAYEKKHNMNPSLIKFAKIDFNIVQTGYQEDLKYVSSWWKETCFGNQLHFARDNIVENYLWAVGIIYEPEFGYIRRILTVLASLVTTIDDIYDIYGTLEELELFTSMVECWNIHRLNELPEYMRLCFLTLYNEVNGMGCDILKYKNIDVIPFFKKSWTDLCKAHLVEANWYRRGYKPSLEEYIQTARISVAAQIVSIHFYCANSNQISIQILESLSQHQQQVVQCSATVFRLANDLATSSDEMVRGDVPKSIQCYMHETGATEEEARAHVLKMISDTWDKMNYEARMAHTSVSLSRGFVEAAMNLARTSQCIYQHSDRLVQSLLVNPIPLD